MRLLCLVGGPAGLLVWTLGGACGGIAGKHFGHQFDKNELKALTTGMDPNTSAIIAIVENKAAEAMATAPGRHHANGRHADAGQPVVGRGCHLRRRRSG